MNQELIKEIKNWVKDFEASQPRNVIIDPEDQSFESSAYYILKAVLKEDKKLTLRI